MSLETIEQDPENVDVGKYRLLLRLGRGGMAEVYVAVARGLAGFNKLVVVKRLLPAMASDDGFREMFMQEARLAARLNHPNVVQTLEVGLHDDGMFLAMEYLEGQPLSRLVRSLQQNQKKLHVATCVRIACDVLAGLHHAHELKDFDGAALKVVHRDISPQNVFVTYEGQVKVLDFGIAKAERTSTKTQPGWLKGKYAYMAPEQFLQGEVDRRVDVFTTATLLWELLAGRSLFGGGTEAQTVKKLVAEPIPRLSSEVPGIDAKLDAVVARALEREPDARFATALEMKEALDEVLARLGAHEDLGRVVSEAFADARRDVEQQISRLLGDSARMSTVAIADLPSSSAAMRTSTLAPSTPASSGSISIHAGVAHTAGPTPVPGADTPQRRLGMAGVIAAGAALVLGTIVVARTVSGPAPSSAPATTSVAAAAPAPPPPTPREAPSDPAAHATAEPSASASSAKSAAPARVVQAPVQRWAPAPQPAAKAPPPATTSAAPPPTPSAAPVAHDDATNKSRPAPTSTSTSPEGRRFRTTL